MNKDKDRIYFVLMLNMVRAIFMNFEKNWDSIANESGITYAQHHALWLLSIKDGVTLDELGNIGIWNKSTTSSLISKLEKKKLVYKEKQPNSRIIKIYLTDDGRKLYEDMINNPQSLKYINVFSNVEPATLNRYLEDMDKLLDFVDNRGNNDFKDFIDEYAKSLDN